MKYLAVLMSTLLCLLHCSPLTVYAEYAYEDSLAALLQASGAEELLDENAFLPEDTDPSDLTALTGLTLTDMLQTFRNTLLETLQQPLRTFSLLIGVILLSAFAASLKADGSAAGNVYSVLCILCAAGIAAEPVINAFLSASQILNRAADFTLAFSGIFGGILAVSGGVTSSAVYQGSMVILCELSMQTAAKLLLPLLRMCLAMGIVDAVNPAVSLEGLLQLTQKLTAWILGLLMAVFTGLLSVQSLVASAADKAGTKAAKFLISGAVPIIGGAVSDAYTAVLGSMGVLKSGVGMLGILALLSMLVPVLTELGLYRLLTACAAALAELFAVPNLSRLFRNMECVLATGFSIAVSFSVMFFFSTAAVLLISGTLSA